MTSNDSVHDGQPILQHVCHYEWKVQHSICRGASHPWPPICSFTWLKVTMSEWSWWRKTWFGPPSTCEGELPGRSRVANNAAVEAHFKWASKFGSKPLSNLWFTSQIWWENHGKSEWFFQIVHDARTTEMHVFSWNTQEDQPPVFGAHSQAEAAGASMDHNGTGAVFHAILQIYIYI